MRLVHQRVGARHEIWPLAAGCQPLRSSAATVQTDQHRTAWRYPAISMCPAKLASAFEGGGCRPGEAVQIAAWKYTFATQRSTNIRPSPIPALLVICTVPAGYALSSSCCAPSVP